MSGFWGFTIEGETKLVSVNGDASPGVLGLKVLNYAAEMNPATTAQFVRSLRMVDLDSIPTAADLERAPQVGANRGGHDWETLLAPYTGISQILLLGVAGDATEYGDAAWGFVINFDDNALEVYKQSIARPKGYTGRVLCETFMLVSFYLTHLPDQDLFLEGIREGEF